MTKTLPTNKERWRLHGKLQKEVDKLHGKDSEGDSYAVVDVHDRRDGEWPYMRPVPRVPCENPTPDQMLEAIDAAGNNVESTARMFDQVRRDVKMYFKSDKRAKAIQDAAKEILGEKVTVGRAYDRPDDVPRWCHWVPYKITEAIEKAPLPPTMRCCFFNEVMGFDVTAFKTWLKAGKQMLVKAHGKRIKGWDVRTNSSIGTLMFALVEIPEKERPAITARNRAKREFLEANAQAIELAAMKIEAKLRDA